MPPDAAKPAEVIVNGKSLGSVWKQPFRVDVTNTLKEGENNIEIKETVGSVMQNRMLRIR